LVPEIVSSSPGTTMILSTVNVHGTRRSATPSWSPSIQPQCASVGMHAKGWLLSIRQADRGLGLSTSGFSDVNLQLALMVSKNPDVWSVRQCPYSSGAVEDVADLVGHDRAKHLRSASVNGAEPQDGRVAGAAVLEGVSVAAVLRDDQRHRVRHRAPQQALARRNRRRYVV
jgi:hypothetical protein